MSNTQSKFTWQKHDDPPFVRRDVDDPEFTRKRTYAEILAGIMRLDPNYKHVAINIDVIMAAAARLDSAAETEIVIKKVSRRCGVGVRKLKEDTADWARQFAIYDEEVSARETFGEAFTDGDSGGGEDAGPNPFGTGASAGGLGVGVHVQLARLTLAGLKAPICFHTTGMYVYRDGLWVQHNAENESAINNMVETWIHGAVEAAMAAGNGGSLDNTAELRSETRRFIRTLPELRYEGKWNAHGLTPLANGLFDRKTRTLRPYTPEDRATWRLAVSYDLNATFNSGKQMFTDMFSSHGPVEGPKYELLMQEKCYVAIFMQGRRIGRALRRATYFHGPRNSGKSQPVDLMQYVFGDGNYSSMPLDAMADPSEGRFAIGGVIDAPLWAANEATQESTRLPAAKIKALFAEDEVSADVKSVKKRKTGRFLSAAFFSSNSSPRTRDAADGFADRLDLIGCGGKFDPENPSGVGIAAASAGHSTAAEYIFATEGAGLLNWALEVGEHMELTMAYTYPDGVRRAREEISDNANPIRTFDRECLEETDTSVLMTTADIFEVYKQLFEEEHGRDGHPMSPKNFWPLLNGAHGGKRGSVPRTVAKVRRGASVAAGLKFSEFGLEVWRRAKGDPVSPSAFHKEKAYGFSENEKDILSRACPEMKARIDAFFSA